MIGAIDACPEAGEPHAGEDTVRDTFSHCWMLNGACQGKGYAFEADRAFFDYLFAQKGARHIYAHTENYNLSSQHLRKKLGMRREGVFTEFISSVNNPDGTPQYENTVRYAILKRSRSKTAWSGVGLKGTHPRPRQVLRTGHLKVIPPAEHPRMPADGILCLFLLLWL